MRSLFCGSADAAAAVSGKVVEPSVVPRVCYASLVSTFLLHRCLPDCQVSVAVERLSPPTLHFPPHWKTVVEGKTGVKALGQNIGHNSCCIPVDIMTHSGYRCIVSIVSRHC